MKLLILTQKVDTNDPVLGFFCGWITALSEKNEKIAVYCLEKGVYNFPSNVSVFSLGKEEGVSRLKYISRFFSYLYRMRREYDTVFVHMNQEYVLLGALLWRLFGKKIFLWRNHAHGNIFTRISIWLSHAVFYTSPQSFTARFGKAHKMPVGIDTQSFRPDFTLEKKKNSILFLGRIAPVKHVEVFIEALKILRESKVDFHAAIVGSAHKSEIGYQEMLRKSVRECGLDSVVEFKEGVKQSEAVHLYNEYEIFINTTPSGSLDKTQFEAMACGSLVLTGNQAFKDILPEDLVALCTYTEGNPIDLARRLEILLRISGDEKKGLGERLRHTVSTEHSLESLISQLTKAFLV